MAITKVNQIFNPITGVFGSGNIMVYAGSTNPSAVAQTSTTFTWTVPAGVDAVRVRLWGGGGYLNGAGGGFAIKSIYGLSGTTSVLITVGFGGNSVTVNGATSSFGSFVSATGGVSANVTAGTGTGGDINTSGGAGSTAAQSGGGGVGSIFGNGASAFSNYFNQNTFGGGGAGVYEATNGSGAGFIGAGASDNQHRAPGSGIDQFSIDFLGTGGGGGYVTNGRNGGGGGRSSHGGIPGGGGGSTSGLGAPGFVIVEW
jgi:hypothetical protein